MAISVHGVDENEVRKCMDIANKMVNQYQAVNNNLNSAKEGMANVVDAINDAKGQFSDAYAEGASTKTSIEQGMQALIGSAQNISNSLGAKIDEVNERINFWRTLASNCGHALIEAQNIVNSSKSNDQSKSVFGIKDAMESNKKIKEMADMRFNIDGSTVTVVNS